MGLLTWLQDPTSLNHATAECAATDMCPIGQRTAVVSSPGAGEPKIAVTCMQANPLTVDLYLRVRALSFDTSYVKVYLTEAAAVANAGGASLVGGAAALIDVNLNAEPWDFTIVNGPAGPDITGWHVAIVPINVTPANPLDAIYKLTAPPSETQQTSDFLHNDFAVDVDNVTDSDKFRAILDNPYAEWRKTAGSSPRIMAKASDVAGVTDGHVLQIEGEAFIVRTKKPDVDAEFVVMDLEAENPTGA